MLWSSPGTVKNVVMIQSTLELQREVYEEVVDETAELLHLSNMIKKCIQEEWPSSDDKKLSEKLKEAFNDANKDKNNLLGSKGLKELFKELDFTLHNRQCDLIIE